MQNHKCNEVENAFPIFKVSRLVRVHTNSHHNGHNNSWRDIFFFGKHEHGALWLMICGAVEKNTYLLTYLLTYLQGVDY